MESNLLEILKNKFENISKKDKTIKIINYNQEIFIDDNLLVYEFNKASKNNKNRYAHLKWCDTKEEVLDFINSIIIIGE